VHKHNVHDSEVSRTLVVPGMGSPEPKAVFFS
jgi:hypothetical protein